MSTRAPHSDTSAEESPFFATPIPESLAFHLGRCGAFAGFAALFWTVPFAAMFVIVGNADAEAATWMLWLWALASIVTIIAGIALYALFQFAYGRYLDRRARKAIATRFGDMTGADPDRTLVTGAKPMRTPKPAPAKNNVVHADFRGATRRGFKGGARKIAS